MVMALTTAGVTVEKTNMYASSMCKRAPTTKLIEVYGRSIKNQSLLTRRNLNAKGLNALDSRTTKPDGHSAMFANAKTASSPDRRSMSNSLSGSLTRHLVRRSQSGAMQ